MNNQQQQQQRQQGTGSSPLSLLVNAVDSRLGGPRQMNGQNGNFQGHNVAESVLRRGLVDSTVAHMRGQQAQQPRQEQPMPQQQQSQGILQQMNDQGEGLYSQNQGSQQLSQQVSQQLQQQLIQQSFSAEMRAALANAQARQVAQLSNADIITLLRSVPGLLGGNQNVSQAPAAGNMDPPPSSSDAGNAVNGNQVDTQDLVELERRQRVLAAANQYNSAAAVAAAAAAAGNNSNSGQMNLSAEAQIREEQASAAAAAAAAAAKPSQSSIMGSVRSSFTGDVSAAQRASVNDQSNNEEPQKAPGSVIVPCRARGMPMDHNFKTAYFVIPENVQHGEELICSYFSCRNAGVKFRYCSHCKVPVAKRNFRKRHKHGDEEEGKPKQCSDDEENSHVSGGDRAPDPMEVNGCDPEQHGIPFQVTTKRPEENPAPVMQQPVAPPKPRESPKPNQSMEKPRDPSPSVAAKPAAPSESANSSGESYSAGAKPKPISSDSDSTSMRTTDERSKVIESRRQRWEALLATRPSTKDGDSMSAWLMEVLDVSDLWTPLVDSKANNKPNKNSSVIVSSVLEAKANGVFSVPGCGTLMPDSGLSTNGSSGDSRARNESSSDSPGTSNTSGSSSDKTGGSSTNDSSSDTREAGGSSTNDSSSDTREANDVDGCSNDSSSDCPESLEEDKMSRRSKSGIGSSILKKKRPLCIVKQEKNAVANASEAGYSGSFAEWRDRKKHKKGHVS